MERPVKEDFAIRDPARWIFAGSVISFVLIALSVGAWRTHNWKVFAAGLGFALVLFAWTSIVFRGALRRRMSSGRSWMLTDDGLQRNYPDGQRETIRWEQIRHMRWVPLYGLIVRWEEPKSEHQHRDTAFKQEFKWDPLHRQYRANLDVQSDEAQELMSAMQSKSGLSYEQLTTNN